MAVYRLHQKEWEKELRQPPRPLPPQNLTTPSSSKIFNSSEPKPKKLDNNSPCKSLSKRPSSGLSVVVVCKTGEKVVVHGKKKRLGSLNAVSSSSVGSRRGKETEKEKNEWWRQLPGSGAGVVGAAGSKGSITKRKR